MGIQSPESMTKRSVESATMSGKKLARRAKAGGAESQMVIPAVAKYCASSAGSCNKSLVAISSEAPAPKAPKIS